MKRLLLLILFFSGYLGAHAVCCSDQRIVATSGSKMVMTRLGTICGQCTSPDTLLICEYQPFVLNYVAGDFAQVTNYIDHSFTITNVLNPSITYSYGPFTNFNGHTITLPPGSYDVFGTWRSPNGPDHSALLKIKVQDIEMPPPGLAGGHKCVNEPFAVFGEINTPTLSGYVDEEIDMGDGTTYQPNLSGGGGAPWAPPYWEQINTTHTYTQPGIYTVRKRRTYACGDVTSSTIITVGEKPEVDLGPDESFCPSHTGPWPGLVAGNGTGTVEWTLDGVSIPGAGQFNTYGFGEYCATVTIGQCSTTDCMRVLEKPSYDPIDPGFDFCCNVPGPNLCTYYLSVVPYDPNEALLGQQWTIYKHQPPGTTNGGTQVAQYFGSSWNGSNQLPYLFDNYTWYWVKHGHWSDCDPWVEQRHYLYYSCKTGTPLVLDEAEALTPGVYPNPAEDVVHVTGLNGQVMVEVHTVNGQLLLSESEQSTDGMPVAIDISSLKPGSYLIHAYDKAGVTVKEPLIVR